MQGQGAGVHPAAAVTAAQQQAAAAAALGLPPPGPSQAVALVLQQQSTGGARAPELDFEHLISNPEVRVEGLVAGADRAGQSGARRGGGLEGVLVSGWKMSRWVMVALDCGAAAAAALLVKAEHGVSWDQEACDLGEARSSWAPQWRVSRRWGHGVEAPGGEGGGGDWCGGVPHGCGPAREVSGQKAPPSVAMPACFSADHHAWGAFWSIYVPPEGCEPPAEEASDGVRYMGWFDGETGGLLMPGRVVSPR